MLGFLCLVAASDSFSYSGNQEFKGVVEVSSALQNGPDPHTSIWLPCAGLTTSLKSNNDRRSKSRSWDRHTVDEIDVVRIGGGYGFRTSFRSLKFLSLFTVRSGLFL
jgi:hypothetical protein